MRLKVCYWKANLNFHIYEVLISTFLPGCRINLLVKVFLEITLDVEWTKNEASNRELNPPRTGKKRRRSQERKLPGYLCRPNITKLKLLSIPKVKHREYFTGHDNLTNDGRREKRKKTKQNWKNFKIIQDVETPQQQKSFLVSRCCRPVAVLGMTLTVFLFTCSHAGEAEHEVSFINSVLSDLNPSNCE